MLLSTGAAHNTIGERRTTSEHDRNSVVLAGLTWAPPVTAVAIRGVWGGGVAAAEGPGVVARLLVPIAVCGSTAVTLRNLNQARVLSLSVFVGFPQLPDCSPA